MAVSPLTMSLIEGAYSMHAYSDYSNFVSTLDDMANQGYIEESDIPQLLIAFDNPRPTSAPEWEEDADTETYLRNPEDRGPLAGLSFRHGWMDETEAAKLRLDYDGLRKLLGFGDEEVISDIQDNALHILNGCNDPRNNGENWGDNRQGLVYGMVQSGKTASMLSLISLGMRAGYRLFIVLAGDKSSLRDQTQNRVNGAFDVEGGSNRREFIHSPTHVSDFRQIANGNYISNFKFNERTGRGENWTTIIVMKKQTHHLNALIAQLNDLQFALEEAGHDMGQILPTMILDDEADYASQNTRIQDGGSTTHNDLVNLRNAIPRNCYLAYTATPQACLSADPASLIGYPRDFWWMIEPYMDDDGDGIRRPRSYLGSWEVFWEYDQYLLHQMGRNEWPHHEKTSMGRPLGVYMPPLDPDPNAQGQHTSRLTDQESTFLEEILEGNRESPPTIQKAMMDYMITCGIKWWRKWNKTGQSEKPSISDIERSYEHHAMMVHLSLIKENQKSVRQIVEMEWPKAVENYKSFDLETSPENHPFRERWKLQLERSRALKRIQSLPFSDIAYFIDCCLEITTKPIFDHRSGSPYSFYPGKPWIYLLNSDDEGMELQYDKNKPREILTKRAAIIVGGNILSRGLTIEGLCVTVFGRTAAQEMGDTVLQRGRWFGHKMGIVDITAIHLQDEAREFFRQIAEADRYLRLQIKQALWEGHTPMEVLIELRNSPYFRATSSAKSAFLNDTTGSGFAGKRAMLTTPSFDTNHIVHNDDLMEKFLGSHATERAHDRGFIARDVDPDVAIKLLEKLKCDKDAPHVSFQVYADYLKQWRVESNKGSVPQLPAINIAIMDAGAKRQRRLRTTNHPSSVEQAQEEVTTTFGAIVGGGSGNKKYKGDYFFDKSTDWHLANDGVDKNRKPGDDILIVFYRLDPNYIRKTIWDTTQRSEKNPHGKKVTVQVRVPKDHSLYVSNDVDVVTFAAWTPEGGPMYGVGVNSLIDVNKVKQRGLVQIVDNGDE